jgi:hypothetical protein
MGMGDFFKSAVVFSCLLVFSDFVVIFLGAGFHSNDFQLQALLHYCNEIPKYVALKVRALVKKLRPTKMLPSIVPAPWDDMAACPSTKFRYSNPSQQYRATAHFFLGPITAWALHLNRATVFVANLPPK